MNSSAPVAYSHANHNLKPFMSIEAFRRALEQAIAQGNEGAVDYALQNLYFGIENVLSVNHVTQITSSEER